MEKGKVRYENATNCRQFSEIIELQGRNTLDALPKHVGASEGFVTLEHTLDQLQRISGDFRHAIAIDSMGDVVGYALVMLNHYVREFPEITPHIVVMTEIYNDVDYCLMGQICIDKDYRGDGIFAGLYNHLSANVSRHFRKVATIISNSNQRSVRAHKKLGFKCDYEGENWIIVSIDL